MEYQCLSLGSFTNRHAGESATVVGRGPTRFDYRDLKEAPGPVFFINDTVQFDHYVNGPCYLFAVDSPMVRLLQSDLRALPVVPRDMEKSIRSADGKHVQSILFYECGRTPRERLLLLDRDELASLEEIYNGSATILSALHFIWFCGCGEVRFIGCDGINDAPALLRMGNSDDGYDKRLKNISGTAPLWKYARIREEQERLCRQLGLKICYLGTPVVPHPNRFHRPVPQIPAIAHFIWLDGPMPEFMHSNITRFRELHPHWDIRIWHGLPEQLPEEIRQLCLRLHQLCMRSDVVRIWLLHEHGGVYLDGDVYPVREFDELLHFTHFFASENGDRSATNCVMGAPADSEFTQKLMDRVQAACKRPEPPSARTAFGPILYTGLIRSFGELVNPLPSHYFCPFEDHRLAFALTQKPFREIHRALASLEKETTDNVWPYGIHTYGIPGNQLAGATELSSWTPTLGRGDALLRRLASSSVSGAEIGVADGKMSAYLLGHHPMLSLFMVDRWALPPVEGSYVRSVDEKAHWSTHRHEEARLNARNATEFASDRRSLVQAESVDAAKQIDDRSLDFAFIDADHSYDAVKADIAVWLPKIRRGGWLCGHDYRGVEGIEWGIRRSVDEFVAKTGWPLELDENDTWFIKVG